jgi:hypothetical protein
MKSSSQKSNTNKVLFLLLILTHILSSCDTIDNTAKQNRNFFSVDENNILKNGNPLAIKGVVYVPGYPGYLPWDLEKTDPLHPELCESINRDIADIKALGANTIRFWGAPAHCYRALKDTGDLNFIQTIWIDSETNDFQAIAFKEDSKSYIREIVDRIYSVYTDEAPPLVLYLIGNEFSESSITSTDAAHPDINSYSSNFITTTTNVSATEAFLAEIADYLKTYESENYGNVSLVSYANFLYTADIIDTPFLDLRCHNVYPYDIPFRRPDTATGSSSGTYYQGWVEEIKLKYPGIPLLITETGLSVSPNAIHIGPPHYGYGGNSEEEQANGLIECINDIDTAILPIAGLCIHEYLDAWWKFGLEDSYSQDPDDVEEWFGLVRFTEADNWYETEFRPAYNSIQERWTQVQ